MAHGDSVVAIVSDSVVGIIVIGLIGLLSDLFFKWVNRKLFPWAKL